MDFFVVQFEFTLAKANYLLNYSTQQGMGGDKQKFWREVMGFDNPEAIQQAIMAEVSIQKLEWQDETQYGKRYRAYLNIRSQSGRVYRIRTVWIVLTDENIARFVTAIPD